MKVVLFTSVVALVAGQPQYFTQTPPMHPQGICSAFHRKIDSQCCIDPGFHPGRCERVPGPIPFFGRPPPPPPPQFLSEVCCESGTRCCMKDSAQLMFPSYTCCPEATHNCVVTDGKGACVELVNQPQGVPPLFVGELDRLGRCPDGLPPITHGPNQPFICSSAVLVNGAWGASTCPTDTYCAKDRTTNQNTGVCCRDSHCTNYKDCQTCVRTEEHTFEPKNLPCSWLTQGDGIGGTVVPNTYNNVTGTVEKNLVGGRCVATCDTFPEKSCILPHATGTLCPKTVSWMNGTDYNVGSCARRCGMVGTGRSSRINQGMEAHIIESDEATPCCTEQPNDYCCAWDGTLADHCGTGRVKGGPVCGVPISGTPNNFFNSPQPVGFGYPAPGGFGSPGMGFGYPGMGFGYPGMGFGYPGMGFGYPGMGFGYPGMGFGYPGMGFGFGGPMMYNSPMMYRNYATTTEMGVEEAQKAAQAENDKMFMYPPVGPAFYRPLPPPPPPPPPPAVDQQPSAHVCSCDDLCIINQNADCCSDYYQTCGFGDLHSISLGVLDLYYPSWWIYDKPLSRSNRS